MNTLSRAVTARFFTSPTRYHALKQHWSMLVNSERKHELTTAHHVLYLALLGKDWRKAFSPITNQRKLANGAFSGWSLFRVFAKLHSTLHDEQLLAPFDDHITAEALNSLRQYLPTLTPWDHVPDAYSRESWPLDAHRVLVRLESAPHA